MLNYLWAGMIFIGIVYGAFNGRMPELTNAALESAGEAVSIAITMLGVMSFWCGLMEIASKAGIVEAAAEKAAPILRFLFPELPKGHPAEKHIAINFIANMLGLGWAATPAGLKAMEELEKVEEGRRKGVIRGKSRKKGIASNEMCTFLIINISSLQLLPVNIIAYRSTYGSADPAWVIGPGLAATAVSTLAAVAFCKVAARRGN